MKRTLTLVALFALAVAPALAGAGHGCEASTQDCLNMMVKNMQKKGLIGVDGEWNEVEGSFTIKSYLDNGNAEAAGVKIGDKLVAINGIKLNDKEASYADYENRKPGSEVEITVIRGESKKNLAVELVGMSDEQVAKSVGQHMIEHAEVQVAKAE